MSSSTAACAAALLLVVAAATAADVDGSAFSYPPLTDGLSFSFYKSSCPELPSVVHSFLKKAFKNNTGLAAGLLRLHFHDCFVQGCDGSILLDGSASGPSEQQAPPNLTLQPAAFEAINELRAAIDAACGPQVVSCADTVALAARESVYLSGGPKYKVPLGRRDGLTFATRNVTLQFLPPPTATVPKLIAALAQLNLDVNDLVALSGGHTIGRGHCTSFDGRLFPQVDPTMNKWFAGHLKLSCPAAGTDNTTVNDIRTPNKFDNKYYVDLMNREGLFTSDQDMYTNTTTKDIVKSFAINQTLFFEKFVYSIVKMGQLSVLTGGSGEIRANCSARNGDDAGDLLRAVVGTAGVVEGLAL